MELFKIKNKFKNLLQAITKSQKRDKMNEKIANLIKEKVNKLYNSTLFR